MTIHDYTLSEIKKEDSIDNIIRATLFDYKLQNKLNKSLLVSNGKYFDEYLIHCIVGEVFDRFGNYEALLKETKKSFLDKVLKEEHYSIENNLISEHNLSLLTGLLRSKFANKNFNIDDVIEFINELSPKEETEENITDFYTYLNDLISKKNMTLNQLGNISLIKKGIYDITLDKAPTKNQLIMLAISLKLGKEEYEKLFILAKELVKNSSESNIYSFEDDNKRDSLLRYWLLNIDELKKLLTREVKH